MLCGDHFGNILIFYPRDKDRHMFQLNEISFDSKNQKNVTNYEFNKILTMSFDLYDEFIKNVTRIQLLVLNGK